LFLLTHTPTTAIYTLSLHDALPIYRDQLALTVRFVASDEEELGGLAGARNYAAYIKALSQTQGFQLVAAVDDEQSGWNCSVDKRSEEHTSELQSLTNLVCRLLLAKK